jgi:DNA-binding response OmpR family regulator
MSGASDDPEGLGSYPLLSKPFRPDELITAVEGALKRQSESIK